MYICVCVCIYFFIIYFFYINFLQNIAEKYTHTHTHTHIYIERELLLYNGYAMDKYYNFLNDDALLNM